MTEAIYYLDSIGCLWERVPDLPVMGSGVVVHPELGGSEVYWRRAPADVLERALACSAASAAPEGDLEDLRALSVDECEGCGPGGRDVRYCPIHGLHGTAPR
jgi:hypothetical protein